MTQPQSETEPETCPICYEILENIPFIILTCKHKICYKCHTSILIGKIEDGEVDVPCSLCRDKMDIPHDILNIIGEKDEFKGELNMLISSIKQDVDCLVGTLKSFNFSSFNFDDKDSMSKVLAVLGQTMGDSIKKEILELEKLSKDF